jgi:hypothetical protein
MSQVNAAVFIRVPQGCSAIWMMPARRTHAMLMQSVTQAPSMALTLAHVQAATREWTAARTLMSVSRDLHVSTTASVSTRQAHLHVTARRASQGHAVRQT